MQAALSTSDFSRRRGDAITQTLPKEVFYEALGNVLVSMFN